MSEGPPLLWAVKNTFGMHCVRGQHGLTFAGEGFLVHVLPTGKVALRLAEGIASEPQGWLISALAEFLAPAGGERTAEGVSVPVGQHVVHFGTDGHVRVERNGAARNTDARHDASRWEIAASRHGRVRLQGPASAQGHGLGDEGVQGHHGPRSQTLPAVVPVMEHRNGKRAIVFRPKPAVAEPEPADPAPAEGETVHGAIEALWQRWATRAVPADPAERARTAKEDRIAIRGLLDSLRAQGPLHAVPRRSVAVRLLALDHLLSREPMRPTPA